MNIDFTIEFKDILAMIISPIFIAITTQYLIERHPGSYERERYEKVVFPIFDKLETILYKKNLSDEDLILVKECRKIVDKNRMIAGGRLLHCFAQDEKTNFKSMSRKIDLEYDLCTRKLGLPLRPIDYRLNRSRGAQVFFLSLYISRLLVSSGALIFFAFIVYRLLLQIL